MRDVVEEILRNRTEACLWDHVAGERQAAWRSIHSGLRRGIKDFARVDGLAIARVSGSTATGRRCCGVIQICEVATPLGQRRHGADLRATNSASELFPGKEEEQLIGCVEEVRDTGRATQADTVVVLLVVRSPVQAATECWLSNTWTSTLTRQCVAPVPRGEAPRMLGCLLTEAR